MARRMDVMNSCQGCPQEDDDDMVQCDTCNGWYHYGCVGPDITDDIANYTWNCERCVIGQFKLTLKNDESASTLQNTARTSSGTLVNEVSGSIINNQKLVLELIEAQRKLEEEQLQQSIAVREEQLKKSFEIQRRFLQQRFSVLNQRESDIMMGISNLNIQNESVDEWLNQPKDLTSKQVQFEKAKFDIGKDVKMGSSTPIRTPSTMFERSENEMSFIKCDNEENLSQQRKESLFVPNYCLNDPECFPKSLQESINRSRLADITKLGNNSQRHRLNQREISQDKTFDINQPVYESNFPSVNQQPVGVSTASAQPIMLNQNQIAARHVLPRDLPKFFGSPKEWPMFISSYESSTLTGGYTNSENLIRLQRCLQGKAMEAVRSILLTPDNVTNVIETLRMMYGRPDLIIHSLIQQIREEQPPRMEKLETIINYALSVRNLCAIIQATHLESHMNNPYLMQEIVERLPSTLRLEWARYKRTFPNASMLTMGNWLYDVAQAASDVVSPNIIRKEKAKGFGKQEEDKPKQDRFYVASHKDGDVTSVTQKCKICQESCTKVSNCKKFQVMTVDQRWNIIKEKKMCSTCLKVHRRFQCKDKKKCKEIGCDAWHHIMLHKDPVKTAAVHHTVSVGHMVIYQIVPVMLYGPSASVMTYAYLDGGSGITLLEEGLAATLGLEGEQVGLHLKWTSKIQRSESNSMKVGLQISDVFGTKKFEMNNVRTVRTLELPEQTLSQELIRQYSHLKNIPIQPYVKAVSRILIGLENINLIVSSETVEGRWQEPVATKTRLGWVLQGGPQFYNNRPIYSLPIREAESDLHQLVKSFFSIESMGVKMPEKIIESKQAERARKIMETTTIIANGQSETGLLWKSEEPYFPNNKDMAMKRLENLERRMMKDPKLHKNMNEHLADYQLKNYTRKLSSEELESHDGPIWYLPIFPVYDPKKPEKFRIVWDAAAKVAGVSLNTNLLTGPDLLIPLTEILHRFREKAIAIDGDIKEMFHQIGVRKEDQNVQRFLWRDGDQTKEPDIFVMQKLTFGATCSPSISQFVKNTNAKRFEDQYPKAVNTITKNHYVDNMIDCTHTADEAVTLATTVKHIHEQAGFELCKFRSNSSEVLQCLGVPLQSKAVNMSFTSDIERVLGMFWQISSDTFTFSLQFTNLTEDLLRGNRRPTKREVLRTLMTIFDPLGLLSFFLIYAKILLQEIWSSKVGWDEKITDVQFVKWTTWVEMLPEIENLQIPRLYSTKISPNDAKSIELHVFVDASELAFSAVGYLRIENEEGVECILVGSKTRVAPLKPMSIPRLELQAGVLGSRYMKYLTESHTLIINRRIVWTDSRVLLQWIHSEERKYRQFVAFRVGEILELTEVDEWRWVPTKDNVADDATKWVKKPVMAMTNRWFNGPEFLKEHNNWEMDWSTFDYEDVEEELRFQASHQELIPPECPNPNNFSKWERLWRTQAYVFRVICNVKSIFKIPKVSPLTSEELSMAENSLFRRAQFDDFGEEVAILSWNKNHPNEQPKYLDSSSMLFQSSPYMDDSQVIRVHGRIDATPGLTLDNYRPIILPRSHQITKLIIDWYHRKFHHANHQTVINELKQRFHIPRMRVVLKSVVTKCQFCKNKRAQPIVPSMADLPAARLTPWTRVFSFTGIDFFGPLLITVKRKVEKRWGVLFTCLTTRAIHIEIVEGLDTNTCIMVIRDFMVLYGQVADFYSDNGTNFHGSENELREEFEKMDPKLMQEEFTTTRTKWHFNPAAASHMGGSWERLIRSVKNSLYYILDNRKPSYQVLKNVLRECQGIVNSRPLTFVSVASEDQEALTPYHFLIGTSGGLPELCEVPDEKYIRRDWITSQLLANQFWTRWVREYLPTITRRTKWFRGVVKPIEVGDVVYIVDEKLKRYSWPKGIITSVFMGKDKQVRSAMVRIHVDGKNKEYHRPASKLAVLDITPPAMQAEELQLSNVVTENINPITPRKVLLPLPKFSGLAEEWSTFINLYESSTVADGITNEENFIRLRCSLHGAARDLVNRILLSPDDVPMAIQHLKDYFQPPQL